MENQFKDFEYKHTPDVIPRMTPVLQRVFPKKEVIHVSYIYLIREREHVEACRNVYKFGRCCQSPENYIDRLRQYKKGSEIIMVIQCDDAHAVENKIRTRFKDEFCQHRDGHEHYYGDVHKMMHIILEYVMNCKPCM